MKELLMKKKILVAFSFICLVALLVLSINQIRSKDEMIISIEKLEVPIQSDVLINLIQPNEVVNIATFYKDKLENGTEERRNNTLDIKEDGKVVLQVEINDSCYEGIVIPYITNGNSISYIELQIKSENNVFYLSGEYSTRLEKAQKINSKLENVSINGTESKN